MIPPDTQAHLDGHAVINLYVQPCLHGSFDIHAIALPGCRRHWQNHWRMKSRARYFIN